MLKAQTLIVSILVVCSTCKPKLIGELRIDEKLMKQSQWGAERTHFGWVMGFQDNNEAYLSFAGEGCGSFTGRYQLDDPYIVKFDWVDQDKECLADKTIAGVKECALKEDKESLFYDKYLLCTGNEKFYCWGCATPAGKNLKVGGLEATTMGSKKVIFETTMNVRTVPSLTGEIIKCKGEPDSDKRFIKGEIFRVLARTRDKLSVKNWSNYWYYIHIKPGWYEECSHEYGWVFGEWLGIQELKPFK